MARILHVTDFHYRRHWFEWLSQEARKFDLVAFSGDLIDGFPHSKTPLREQVLWVSDWCRALPCQLVTCSGNHDVVAVEGRPESAESAGRWLSDLRQPGRIFVDCDDVDVCGFRVLVWPWSGRFSPTPDGRPTLLVSHAGPAYSSVSKSELGEFGDVSVEGFLRGLTAPSWALSGHVHERSAWHDLVERAHCSNPGVSPWSAPHPNHVVLDTKRRMAVFHEWSGDADFVRF
jgi:Icc-related predicted phosphoesterase